MSPCRCPGAHNVKNALAAAAAAIALRHPRPGGGARACRPSGGPAAGLSTRAAATGADVYDDYAHHPGELKALLGTASNLGYQRVICAFQPHTYTRTKAPLRRLRPRC